MSQDARMAIPRVATYLDDGGSNPRADRVVAWLVLWVPLSVAITSGCSSVDAAPPASAYTSSAGEGAVDPAEYAPSAGGAAVARGTGGARSTGGTRSEAEDIVSAGAIGDLPTWSRPAGAGGVVSADTTGGIADRGTGGDVERGTGGRGDLADGSGTGGSPAGTGGSGTCCPDGNCLCHGPDPSGLTSSGGPFDTDSYAMSAGTVHYPTDAQPPFAGVAICGGLTNTGPEMESWGPFYASHGIVAVITTTGALDQPATRARALLGAIEELKAENTNSGSPLAGKLSDRFGTSGYSMGGGGTTIASSDEPTLKTSVGLAAWSPTGNGIQVPTLLLCGSSDGTAPCSMSQSAYEDIPESTPKMMVTISGASHLSWFGPTSAGSGISGETALAFQKVFLEGDERWRPYLLQTDGTVATNIQ